ncbi:MAG: hypothetical protein EOO52_05330 [Gammaproteobacteria bacterium]|nr:MAG: hypothetical protein EOO52_05330 [Gammaproteobacteria bacterium]
MSIQRNLFTFLIATLTTLLSLTSNLTQAADCSKIKKQIERYEDLRRNGGSAKSMSRWTATGHQLEEKYRQCGQDRSVIQIVSGKQSQDRKKATTHKHLPLRKDVSDNPQIRKLTQTCNYWIGVANENPTDDNRNFRETACHAADNYEVDLESVAPLVDTIMVRKLKDCIKSNNLIDQEVNECMRGTLEPIWKNNR